MGVACDGRLRLEFRGRGFGRCGARLTRDGSRPFVRAWVLPSFGLWVFGGVRVDDDVPPLAAAARKCAGGDRVFGRCVRRSAPLGVSGKGFRTVWRPFDSRWLTALRARVGVAMAGLWGCGGGGSTTVCLLWRLQGVSVRAGIGFLGVACINYFSFCRYRSPSLISLLMLFSAASAVAMGHGCSPAG